MDNLVFNQTSVVMSVDRIEKLQEEIYIRQKELNALQRPEKELIKDYELRDKHGNGKMLSSLFGEAEELLVIHNMGKACSYCTMWADVYRGMTEIMADRMPWVLTSPDEPAVLKMFGESRGWNFNTLSHAGTDFAFDLGFEKRDGNNRSFAPGVSALILEDGKIYRVAKDIFGPGDNYNPVWHFINLFPKGANGWTPKYIY